MSIGIIGVGAIGEKLVEGFTDLGHDVVAYDTDPGRRAALDYTTREPDEMGSECSFVLVAVPTPTTANGGSTRHVRAALSALGEPDATVVLRSTMPPGSTHSLAQAFDLPLVYAPEFLRDRAPVSDFFNPDRTVVAGPEPERSEVLDLLTHRDIDAGEVIECEDYLTAELGKYAHNALFATKVSFANQIRLVCEETGADVETVMDIVVADHRNTGSHLDPTLGPYAGKCLPKDLEALTHYYRQLRVPAPLLRAVAEVNSMAEMHFENRQLEGE